MTALGYNVKRVGDHSEAVPRYPKHFDGFLTFETTDGRNCPIDSIKADPKKLAVALTGGNLWVSTSEGRIAHLNAPETFREGSIYHLDFNYYGEENSLMKSHLGGGAIHSPGPVVLQILNSIPDIYARSVFECFSSVEPFQYPVLNKHVSS